MLVFEESDRTAILRRIRKHAAHATKSPRGRRRDRFLDRLVEEVQMLILVERHLALDPLERIEAAGRVDTVPVTREQVQERIGRLMGETGLVLP